MGEMRKRKEVCPDCGGEVKYYHGSAKGGDGFTRVVCKDHCKGWKVIREIDILELLRGGKNNND